MSICVIGILPASDAAAGSDCTHHDLESQATAATATVFC